MWKRRLPPERVSIPPAGPAWRQEGSSLGFSSVLASLFSFKSFHLSCSDRRGAPLHRLAVLGLPRLGGKEDSEGTAFRSKRPRCNYEHSKEQVDENVKRGNGIIANRRGGGSRSRHIEKDAGVRPF